MCKKIQPKYVEYYSTINWCVLYNSTIQCLKLFMKVSVNEVKYLKYYIGLVNFGVEYFKGKVSHSKVPEENCAAKEKTHTHSIMKCITTGTVPPAIEMFIIKLHANCCAYSFQHIVPYNIQRSRSLA